MFKLLFNPVLYFHPDAVAGSDTRILPDNKPDSKEDIIEFLSDDDDDSKDEIPLDKSNKSKQTDDKSTRETDKTPPKREAKTDEDSEEEIQEPEEEADELALLEEEIAEPTDEQLELVTPVRRREILKQYPDLFKKFPYLEKAYYREQQFTEMFPTIQDAKIASDKSQVLDEFEREVMSGNTERILRSVMQQNVNSFYKLVDNYMPTLQNVDEKAYFHVIGNIMKQAVWNMMNEGNKANNDQLRQAAHILHQFMFANSDWQPPTNLAKDEKPEDKTREDRISERERHFITQQFENARDTLNTRVNNTLKNTIEANIDPRNSMSEYVKRQACRDASETLERLISGDRRFISIVDKLWDKAAEDGFSRESVDRIRAAFTSKAKALLPSVIKKARNDALRGMGKRVREDNEETTASDKRGPVATGKPRSQSSSGKIRDAKDIPRNMSTLDFLNAD